jgi:hypothetical protein
LTGLKATPVLRDETLELLLELSNAAVGEFKATMEVIAGRE